jgi:hypothetical protein
MLPIELEESKAPSDPKVFSKGSVTEGLVALPAVARAHTITNFALHVCPTASLHQFGLYFFSAGYTSSEC